MKSILAAVIATAVASVPALAQERHEHRHRGIAHHEWREHNDRWEGHRYVPYSYHHEPDWDDYYYAPQPYIVPSPYVYPYSVYPYSYQYQYAPPNYGPYYSSPYFYYNYNYGR